MARKGAISHTVLTSSGSNQTSTRLRCVPITSEAAACARIVNSLIQSRRCRWRRNKFLVYGIRTGIVHMAQAVATLMKGTRCASVGRRVHYRRQRIVHQGRQRLTRHQEEYRLTSLMCHRLQVFLSCSALPAHQRMCATLLTRHLPALRSNNFAIAVDRQ